MFNKTKRFVVGVGKLPELDAETTKSIV